MGAPWEPAPGQHPHLHPAPPAPECPASALGRPVPLQGHPVPAATPPGPSGPQAPTQARGPPSSPGRCGLESDSGLPQGGQRLAGRRAPGVRLLQGSWLQGRCRGPILGEPGAWNRQGTTFRRNELSGRRRSGGHGHHKARSVHWAPGFCSGDLRPPTQLALHGPLTQGSLSHSRGPRMFCQRLHHRPPSAALAAWCLMRELGTALGPEPLPRPGSWAGAVLSLPAGRAEVAPVSVSVESPLKQFAAVTVAAEPDLLGIRCAQPPPPGPLLLTVHSLLASELRGTALHFLKNASPVVFSAPQPACPPPARSPPAWVAGPVSSWVPSHAWTLPHGLWPQVTFHPGSLAAAHCPQS